MIARAIFRKLGRTTLLLTMVAIGSVLLIRFAPGYFSDAREMDAKYAQNARNELATEQQQQGSLAGIARAAFAGYLHGSFGQSRQYEVPVSELIRERARVTVSILARGIIAGWLLAFAAALPLSMVRRGGTLLGLPFTLLLAVPTGAAATLCLLANHGGPVLVLTLLLAARDFKFLERTLRSAWKSPHLLQARAQGLRLDRMLLGCVLPEIAPRLLSLATLSLLTALSAIVPIEVVFDTPGLGQLAWSAAMNRDLPVLLAVTLLMATAVVLAGVVSQRLEPMEAAA